MPLTRNQSNAASQAKLTSNEASETSTSKETADQGGTSTEEPPRRDSPENCSICLGPFNNKSFTSSCAHSFCFVCLKQWSKVKAECPLCKQPFTSIFHNIRSNQQYDIYELPHQPNNQIEYSLFNYVGGAMPTFTGAPHLFSLPQPAFDADLTLSNFSRFQFRHRRYDRYLNPLSINGEHPYSFSGPAVNPSSHISAATWPRGAEEFRREVYRRNIGPPAVILGCENSNYRLTPAMVAASAHRLHRIMPWLTRELRVLLRSHQNVRLAISIIQPLLTQFTVDSVYFSDKVVPLIGHRSRQFVQEFVAFANSALSVQAYDRKAMYRRREVAPAVPSSSSSPSSENDVVEVTDISPELYPNTSVPGPSQMQPLNAGHSGWDSPTPGPSWSNSNVQNTAGQNQASVIDRVSVSSESDDPVYRPDLHVSASEDSRPGSDIIFVKYDKPWNERSPINLTSDSEAAAGTAERGRKKKKSKHKKKKKEIVDNVAEASGSSKKDKNRKSKHRDKSKDSSKATSDEEKDPTVCNKRHHSLSSTEQIKIKKHKKSKSRKEKLSDREIVDRYFAEAMAQHDKEPNPTVTDDKEPEVSHKRKENEKSGNNSSKEKSKKKKKSRKHSKDSHSQSYTHTCKKHHSGHKKTSNRLTDNLPESHNRHHKRSPIRGDPAGTSGRSPRHETTGTDNLGHQDASSGPMPHSMVPGFQPPYLSMTDTVQHIPVNLWVSTWPTLSVSHTYPPPPSSLPMGQSVPQASSTSAALPSTSTVFPNRYPSDMLSISSDSSSDSSDSESDDVQDLQIPSLQNVHSRTKQWLETNFPDLGRPQASSSSANTSSNASSSTNDNPSASTAVAKSPENAVGPKNSQEECHDNMETDASGKDKDVDIEVVSIPSGEEDVVVCSSSEDSSSNVDDLWVIDVDQSSKNYESRKYGKANAKDLSPSQKQDSNGAHNSTLPFSGDMRKSPSSASGIILPPVNKTFQPFKLQKKPALSRGKDPFFPSMTHSSDEDGEVNAILRDDTTNSSSFVQNSVNNEAQDSSVFLLNRAEENTYKLKDIITSTSSLTNPLDLKDIIQTTRQDDVGTSNHSSLFQFQNTSVTVSNNRTSTSVSINSSPIFSVLPSLTSSNTSTTSVMSSAISYLPYSNLTPPTSMSSLLPCYVPQSSLIPPLPLQFPYPQIPSHLTSATPPNPIPSLYPSETSSDQSQKTKNSKISSNTRVTIDNCQNSNDNQPLGETSYKVTEKMQETKQGSQDIDQGFTGSDTRIDQIPTSSNSLLAHEDCESETSIANQPRNVESDQLADSTDVVCGENHSLQQQGQQVLPYDFLDCENNSSFESAFVHGAPQAINSVPSENSSWKVDGGVEGSLPNVQNNVDISSDISKTREMNHEKNSVKFGNVSEMSTREDSVATSDIASKDLSPGRIEGYQAKPFDILEALSIDVPVQDSKLPTSESLNMSQSTPSGTCIVTTVADQFEQSVMLNSFSSEQRHFQQPLLSNDTVRSCVPEVSLLDKKNNTVEAPMNNSYSENDKSPFVDALVSSEASSSGSDSDE